MKIVWKKAVASAVALVALIGTIPISAMENIAKDESWHKYSDVLLSDDFNKDFTWTVNKTGNSPSNIVYTGEPASTWRGCSSKTIFDFSTGVSDPSDGNEKMLKITLPHDASEGAIQKGFWFDNYNEKFTDTRSGKTVVEQSLYFDSKESFLNGHRKEDYFMCQLNYINDEGKTTSFIPYVIRPDGVTSGSLSATPLGNGAITVERDKWIKMVTILDYDNDKWYVYLVEADGKATNVTSGNYKTENYPKPIEFVRYTYSDMTQENKNSYVGIGYVKAYKYCDEDEYRKKNMDIYWQEEFDKKTYSNAGYISGARYFTDNTGNNYIQYMSNAPSFGIVKDPTGADNEVAQITATKRSNGTASYFWFAQAENMLSDEDLTKKHIYEQKYYLTDNALENGGNIMWQVFDVNGGSKIAFVAWDGGFNASNTDSTVADANKYTLPKNEWFTIRAEFDYTAGKIEFYVIKANGVKKNVFTHYMTTALKKGLAKVRATYATTPGDGESVSIYTDDVYYYTTTIEETVVDKTLGAEHNPYLISDEDDFIAFADAVNTDLLALSDDKTDGVVVSKLCAKLTADITLTDESTTPLGFVNDNVLCCYGGIFDGNGYTLTNLSDKAGIVAEGGEGLTFKDLTVTGAFDGKMNENAGAFIVRANASASFVNCVNRAEVTAISIAGGFIGNGSGFSHSFKACSNYGQINAQKSAYAGGFIASGSARNVKFLNCANYGTVSGNGTDTTAGLAQSGTFVNCIGYGDVVNPNGVTAAGFIQGADSFEENCYYRSDAATGISGGKGATASQFESGAVTYAINKNANEIIFGQRILSDAYPLVADSNMVYYIPETDSYSNGEGTFVSADFAGVTFAAAGGAVGYIAQYSEEKKLVGVEIANVTAKPKEYTIIPKEDGEFIKAFIWNDGFKPVSECVEVRLGDGVDFAVEVEEGRDAVVLQLTDVQIIDAAQRRTPDRISGSALDYWDTDKIEERCFEYIKETVEATKPDLILLTGDIVYGEFDDSGRAFEKVVKYMDSLDIPWAPIMGNHEAETNMGVDWQCDLLENAENCLFEQRTISGNGNYTVGIKQGGELKRVFFMLDSNGTKNMSAQTYANGHSPKEYGFFDDQIEWYTNTVNKIKKHSPNVKLTFAYHAPLNAFVDALAQYGYDGTNTPIDIDNAENKKDSDFGYAAQKMNTWDTDNKVYNGIKALGADSMLVGHYHCINASVIYDGIRFQFGNKTGTYDQINYLNTSGVIVQAYEDKGFPVVGGTVMDISYTDGTIADAYHYYCKNEY